MEVTNFSPTKTHENGSLIRCRSYDDCSSYWQRVDILVHH